MADKIKVALVGIGNCFAGLIQGIEYYRKDPSQEVTGIIHDKLSGFGIHDIDFVCGFDVGENKVGTPLNEAIYASPNMVDWIPKDEMPKTDAKVYESPLLDGVGIWVENRVKPLQSSKTIEQLTEEIKKVLKDCGVEIIVSYLPVGSDKVTEFWAQMCLDTHTAFVNCIPSFIASDETWAKKFEEKKFLVLVMISKAKLVQP
jgi:myo-inositol-1-phosphate synthase